MKVAPAPTGGTWWDELIHGGRHVRHVVVEAKKIAVGLEDRRMAKLLLLAAAIHDLGRLLGDYAYPGFDSDDLVMAVDAARIGSNRIDHAVLSAGLLQLMPLMDVGPEEMSAVWFAIRWHSIGLVGLHIERAETLGQKLLGLLVIADHADAASPEGAARAKMALVGKPILSSRFGVDHLRSYLSRDGLECPVIPVTDMDGYKSESVAAHWLYNHQATWPMVRAIEHVLPVNYVNEELLPRMWQYQVLIETLLSLQAS